MEQQYLNDREQELLASVRKSKIYSSHNLNMYGAKSQSQKDISSQQQITSQAKKSNQGARCYNEASQKLQRQESLQLTKESEIKRACNEKKISKGSTIILMKKLERNLNEHLNEIDSEGSRMISFQQLGRLFTVLEIFEIVKYTPEFELDSIFYQQDWQPQKNAEMKLHDLAWQILGNDKIVEKVDVRKVFCLFRIVFDPEKISVENQASILKDYLEKIEPGQIQTVELLHQFCSDFRDCNQVRLANVKIGYLKPTFAKTLIEDYQKTLTFKPTINEVSDAMQNTEQQVNLKPSQRQLLNTYSKQMESSKGMSDSASTSKSLNRVDLMIRKSEKRAMKIQMQQQERDEGELQECTFHPKLNLNSVQMVQSKSTIDRLYQVKSRAMMEQIEQDAKDIRELDDFNQCTFQPQMFNRNSNVNVSQNVQSSMEVKSFDETVQRMRKAIDLQNLQKDKLANVPRGENYDQARSLPVSPPTMLSREKITKEQPALQIKVNMGGGRVGRLSLKQDDEPAKVVRNFAKIWGIGKDEVEDLMVRVHDEMAKLRFEE